MWPLDVVVGNSRYLEMNSGVIPNIVASLSERVTIVHMIAGFGGDLRD